MVPTRTTTLTRPQPAGDRFLPFPIHGAARHTPHTLATILLWRILDMVRSSTSLPEACNLGHPSPLPPLLVWSRSILSQSPLFSVQRAASPALGLSAPSEALAALLESLRHQVRTLGWLHLGSRSTPRRKSSSREGSPSVLHLVSPNSRSKLLKSTMRPRQFMHRLVLFQRPLCRYQNRLGRLRDGRNGNAGRAWTSTVRTKTA